MNQFDYLEYALLAERLPELPARQFVGLPPELTGRVDRRRAMPRASVLVLMRDTSGSIYLFRLAFDGVFAGDTWHPDIAEAKEQAEFEYGGAVDAWHPVPDGVSDLEAFVRSLRP
ncbi:MAG TPA: hypothetical protein VFU63_06465 [Ktedonobacterales bacterium]|nr:hypothetical protein [Ktedonobacterales bacterium]